MKSFLSILICILIFQNAFAINNLYYIGKETSSSYQRLNNIYPPVSSNLVLELNKINFAAISDKILGDLYESHGCIHISPATAKILYAIIPNKSIVNIMKYSDNISENINELPWVSELIENTEALNSDVFKNNSITIYPDKIGVLYSNNKAIGKFDMTNGPKLANYPLVSTKENGELIFDKNHATKTPSGKFTTFQKTKHFYAPAYPETSLLKQGAFVKKINGSWNYKDDKSNTWKILPQKMAQDLTGNPPELSLPFYDLERDSKGKVFAAKWGGHPFGNVSFLLMNERGIVTSILMHTNGELVLEEKEIAHYMAEIITISPEIKWNEYVSSNTSLLQKKYIADFIDDPFNPDFKINSSTVMYKLANNLKISENEKEKIEEYYYPSQRFYNHYHKGQQFSLTAKEKQILNKYKIAPMPKIENSLIAIHTDIKMLDVAMKKTYKWYKGFENFFNKSKHVRTLLNKYFEENNIIFEKEKNKIAYNLINSRINYNDTTSFDLWLKNKPRLK